MKDYNIHMYFTKSLNYTDRAKAGLSTQVTLWVLHAHPADSNDCHHLTWMKQTVTHENRTSHLWNFLTVWLWYKSFPRFSKLHKHLCNLTLQTCSNPYIGLWCLPRPASRWCDSPAWALLSVSVVTYHWIWHPGDVTFLPGTCPPKLLWHIYVSTSYLM